MNNFGGYASLATTHDLVLSRHIHFFKAMAAQISRQKKTQIQAYIRTQKRTRSYTEEDLHGIKWPIDRSTNTAADTATASAEASTNAPDALVNAPK